jgi:predicted GTPase
MSLLRTDLARRIRARSTYVFSWRVSVVALDDEHLRLITYNPRNKRQRAEEVIAIDLDEYAQVSRNEDEREPFIDTIIRSFLYPVRSVLLLED